MSIKKNYVYNVILNISNMLVSLIAMPFVLRMLGPEGIGRVNFALSLMGYFLLIVQIGTSVYGTKEIAKVRDDPKKLDRVFSELFLINCILFAVSLAVYSAVVLVIPGFRGDVVLFAVMGVNLAANVFSIDWYYSGVEEYKFISLRNLAIKTIYVGLIFAFIRTQNDYVKFAMLGTGIILIGNLINMVYLFRRITLNFEKPHLGRHFKPMALMLLAGVIVSIYNRGDIVFLGAMTDAKHVGFYTIAKNISGIALVLISSMGTVLIPRMAYYLNNNMKAKYNEMAEKSLSFMYFASFPVIALFVALSGEILLVYSGAKFLDAAMSLRILSFFILANGLSVFLGFQVIVPNNDEKLIAFGAIPALIVSAAINIIFVKHHFDVATSAAFVCSEAAAVAAQLIMAKKYITFRIFRLQNAIYPAASIVLLALIFYIKALFHMNQYAAFFICPLVFAAFYGGFLFLIKDENIAIIMNMVARRVKPS